MPHALVAATGAFLLRRGFGYTDPNQVIGEFPGKYYSAGPDTQIQLSGIYRFTGRAYLIAGVSDNALVSEADSAQLDGMYDIRIQKGRTFYVIGTMVMGNGGPATNADGSSNFFIQGNPYQQNALFEIGQFESQPRNLVDVAHAEALAFNYSGTYAVNIGVNQGVANDPPHLISGK